MNVGVYVITCLPTRKRYVGSSSVSLKGRIALHKRQLRDNKHHSRYLQRAWNKYGEEAFDFSTIIVCLPEDAVMYEQAAIDLYQPEFNTSPTAGSCLGVKHPPEVGAGHSRRLKAEYAAGRRRDVFAPMRNTPEYKRKLREGKQRFFRENPDVVAANVERMNEATRKLHEVRGEMLTRQQIAEKYGFKQWTINRRIERGLSGEDLIAHLNQGGGSRRRWNGSHKRLLSVKRYLVCGEYLTVSELSEKYNISKALIFDRTKRGVSGDALVHPKRGVKN